MSWTCRLTLNIARSLISLSGRVFFDNSRVVWISSFQSRVCPGMCSSYPKRVEKAVKEMKNIWFKWTTEFSILALRRQAVSKKSSCMFTKPWYTDHLQPWCSLLSVRTVGPSSCRSGRGWVPAQRGASGLASSEGYWSFS